MSIKSFVSKILNLTIPAFITYLWSIDKYSNVNYDSLPLFIFSILEDLGTHSWKILLAWFLTGILIGILSRDPQNFVSSILTTIFTYLFLELYILVHYNIASWNTLPLIQRIFDVFLMSFNLLINGAIAAIPIIIIYLSKGRNSVKIIRQEFKPINCPSCGKIYYSNPKYCAFCGAQINKDDD